MAGLRENLVNASLSLAYRVLAKNLTIACYAVGLIHIWDFIISHALASQAPALEELFRPPVVGPAVLRCNQYAHGNAGFRTMLAQEWNSRQVEGERSFVPTNC
jgi:CRISPR/Cas system-associated endonuclease Cas1